MISATYMVCISPSLHHFSLISGEKKRVFRDAGGRHFLAEKDKVALIHVRDVVARGERVRPAAANLSSSLPEWEPQ